MSGHSGNPWTHELFDGSTRSYTRGSVWMHPQRARKPKDRACEAGGALGMCAAQCGMGEGRAERARRGRELGGVRRARAGSVWLAGGIAALARGRVRDGMRAPWTRSRPPCPSRELVEVEGSRP